jgi:hypothetical protein
MKGKDLRLETQGVTGGNTKTVEKNGFVMVNCEEHRVTFDNFQGRGETYRQRENPLIEIIESGVVLFSGNFSELIYRLKN